MSRDRSSTELLAQAVRVFTEAARLTVTWTDGQGRHQQQPADFAEFVTHALAGAAANVGCIELLLAGRPGSWEADYIREMLQSTVGCDEACLLEHRTDPLIVTVAVDNLLDDLGICVLYEQAEDELDRRENALWAATGDERVLAVEDLTGDQRMILETLDRLRAALEAQRKQDWADYGDGFRANVLQSARELLPELRVPVHVDVRLEWQSDEDDTVPPLGPAFTVWEHARDRTPLPGSGIPLEDYPLEPSLAEIERAAGRDPLSRLERDEAAS